MRLQYPKASQQYEDVTTGDMRSVTAALVFELIKSHTKRPGAHAGLYIKNTLLATLITGLISLFSRPGVGSPVKNQSYTIAQASFPPVSTTSP